MSNDERNQMTGGAGPSGERSETAAAISFTERMVTSEAFMALFREGMALVEETAAYLDGAGRNEARGLERIASLAYASESMRLTTRLMQMTSWLLLQRAVNEGELTREEAEREHRRVRIRPQDKANSDDMLTVLPEGLQSLVQRSLRLQERIQRIDAELQGEERAPAGNPIAAQLDTLSAAFRRG